MSLSHRFLLTLAWMMVGGINLLAQQPTQPAQEQTEFFESRIRPVLVEHCYSCHNSSETAEGELSLDHRDGWTQGGSRGPVIVPGSPESSRLIAVLKHEIDDLEMPEGGPKLEDQIVADFERWISIGAPDPRESPPSASEITAATSWESTLQRRKQWWCFQPIGKPTVPGQPLGQESMGGHGIDRFIRAKLTNMGLSPSPAADPDTLIRRLYLSLIGLPPTRKEVRFWSERFGDAEYDVASHELIDHLLASDHFGERWARHWMDWIRYAESHGSEGDPAIDNAWRYRDYLIRALNADVSYDQLVREHVAGDLLDRPRINESLGINESVLGPTHWRMVFHGFAPTDALDEKVRFVDDQINAFSKAFLGLTVSCARCHDHKFDAISQKDYYALFGILASCRPARSVIDLPAHQSRNRDVLARLKPRIRKAIARDWLGSLSTLPQRLISAKADAGEAEKIDSVIHPILRFRDEMKEDAQADHAWKELVDQLWNAEHTDVTEADLIERWRLSRPEDYRNWYRQGIGLPANPYRAGEFAVAAEGDTVLLGIYPAGVYSHSLSAKHPARLTSADFIIEQESELWVRVIGDSGSSVRYVVQDYPRSGTVYPVKTLTPSWTWQRLDLTYWKGDSVHIELATGKDAPLLVNNQDRSWFGITEARLIRKNGRAPQASAEYFGALLDATSESPKSLDDLATIYATAVGDATDAWSSESASDAQVDLLDGCLRAGLLPNSLDTLPSAAPVVAQYRNLESEIPVPTRIPGLDETIGRTQPLFVRGNHKQPAELVKRRFLEAIDASTYETAASGRLELAEDLVRADNPLTRRVIVNRVWHHLFGRGIVSTPDNFGRLGAVPTHDQLLDWLANRFAEDGWSLKKLIRRIVTSRTWQQSSRPSEKAKQLDPSNLYLSHARVRRMEAEAIRDALLTTSGQLDRTMFGSPVKGESNRRSVYVRVIRNNLDPLLRVFDFPEPYSATGRRDVTNVPAQSLTLMNDPVVAKHSAALATSVLESAAAASEDEQVSQMFVRLLAREASSDELSMAKRFLASAKRTFEARKVEVADLQRTITKQETRIAAIVDPVRDRLTNNAAAEGGPSDNRTPEPIARWDFAGDLKDGIGSLHGIAHKGAVVKEGALAVSSGSYVTTSTIDRDIRAKTLEAWVKLDNLEQRGGGVMTIQTTNGVVFDSIVFGERSPRCWLAGSNNFSRTQPFEGPREKAAAEETVHVAITYYDDGRIVGYRNGKPYGTAYQSKGPIEFSKGKAIISFGVRHLPAGGNRLLGGRIERACLYDRALAKEEVAATFAGADHFVSPAAVLAALSEADRSEVHATKKQIDELRARLTKLGPVPDNPQLEAWTDLARALLTLKEFIYVR